MMANNYFEVLKPYLQENSGIAYTDLVSAIKTADTNTISDIKTSPISNYVAFSLFLLVVLFSFNNKKTHKKKAQR
jgi:Flp pilus assembly protein protease CpaA